jgi:hypothetical protein
VIKKFLLFSKQGKYDAINHPIWVGLTLFLWTKLNYYNVQYRQPLPDDMPEQEGEDEQEAPSDNYCDFTVYVDDSQSKKGLVVEATSMDTEIAFNSILCADDIAKIRAMPRFERSI